MNELYLLSVCGSLKGVIIAAMVGLGLASIIFTSIWASFRFSGEYDYCGEDYRDRTNKCFKITKGLLISFACISVFSAFIPSKRDMYMILGIGGTLDYLQSSETAKQLPEKCLRAIDLWVTNMTEEGPIIQENEHE